MSRRPFALLALTFATLAVSACADTTAPSSAAPTARQIQPSGQASFEVTDPDCKGGYSTSTGRAC